MEIILHIAERIRGLRDALDLSQEDMAEQCGVEPEKFIEYETGLTDIPVSFLHRLSAVFGVEMAALMFGDEPTMQSYYITRAGHGVSVERTGAYSYQDLAAGFRHRIMAPFMVTVEPHEEARPLALNTHEGQEFNYVVEGTLEITVAGKANVLHEGDSIMFDATKPHGLRALGGKRVKMLAIIS
ncbi:MAG: XRE family transcriptional regulator [Muribaculaceae bacterium]|nr:XRE family transcriptional regulator [Muribaculaceae bacterium]MDE6299069.1 XRE family transcriptional regulator [Muribaculaceae bacterium]